MWIISAAAIVAALIGIVARRRAADHADLGWVSETWLAEYRAAHVAHAR